MNLSVFHTLLSMNGMSAFRLQQINKITEMASDFIKCFCIPFCFVKVYFKHPYSSSARARVCVCVCVCVCFIFTYM